jgi:AhpD family alkylhydroperoxidase
MLPGAPTYRSGREKDVYDIKDLGRLSKVAEGAPDAMAAFRAFDKVALAEGAIPKKYKELLALAVAITTQCPYCISVHNRAARAAGASDEEVAEAVLVSAAVRAGGAVTHGVHCFDK